MEEKKRDKLFILIYILVSFSIPTITGLVLTLVYKRSVFLESFYIIFGAITIIFALARSRKRDTKNYRSGKSTQEDSETEDYRSFKRMQLLLYATGIFLFLCSLIAFLIGKYALGF